MPNWVYNGNEIHGHEDLYPKCSDFVYLITYTTGQLYIGKKNIRSVRKRPPLKGKKRNRRLLINHPFVGYVGSHEMCKILQVKTKEILYQCSTKKAATYLETALLFHYNAVFDPKYLNKNISGVHYDNSLDGLLEDEEE